MVLCMKQEHACVVVLCHVVCFLSAQLVSLVFNDCGSSRCSRDISPVTTLLPSSLSQESLPEGRCYTRSLDAQSKEDNPKVGQRGHGSAEGQRGPS